MQENIAPTKANLMASKAALDFSQKGYELLDKKRNVLIREMMGFMDRAEKLQQIIGETFKEAYEALIMANVTLGITEVYEVAKSIPTADETTMLTRSVMGVEIPMIKYEKQDIQHYYSFYHTNTALDVALQKFHEVKYLIYELAEVENSVYKLAVEIKKTQKRANALQNIQIPKYEFLVKMISDVLEEKDREDFFRLKLLKKKKV
ncbi:V-type ATP synthase subunit D [Tepidanaerobacter acetatoxydans Re1]|uniref:V-type ATP synthase subunit D n=1 Tax=Tepidanaerobacter acetatoxydans (strain DSM 21804 / JCM 16047 / Re1) TaxID=1209989 RepID=F4LVD7_TEPAE|nr:V-type ATP synthase subunit D [Tepidanaerobacter acetatoxydans]AEE90712.1 V-type ATP synthase subunit D [Tepidanaerobacter acetatoxydans Re1]CDI40419.1 V-type ATP synthase subunit D [Tepidanaerobacter acetatoxydans Re1]